MQIVAVQKNVRQTPRKLRLVAKQVKDLELEPMLRQLAAIEKRSTVVLLKVVRQAIANAMHNHGLEFKDLTVKSIEIGTGPQYKRFRAVSRGRAHSVVKKTSHVKVVLETRQEAEGSSQEKKADAVISSLSADKAGKAEKSTTSRKSAKAQDDSKKKTKKAKQEKKK